jgi:hypothetical protein
MRPARALRARWNALHNRLGRRGEFLLALALLDFGNAVRLIWPTQETLASPTSVFLTSWAALPVWGLIWAATGVLCAVQAFMASDQAAFGAASMLKVGWALVHLAAFATGASVQAWWSVLLWLVFARVVHVVGGWPDRNREEVP